MSTIYIDELMAIEVPVAFVHTLTAMCKGQLLTAAMVHEGFSKCLSIRIYHPAARNLIKFHSVCTRVSEESHELPCSTAVQFNF